MDRMIVLCLVLMSCRTAAPPAPPPEASATLPAEVEPAVAAADEPLPEPSTRELQHLYTWLAAQDTGFELERLEDCEAQLLVRADRIQSKADIQKAVDDLQPEVRDSVALYHWCYYHMLSRLEYQLEQQGLGRSYQDKLQQFLRESKALFLLADCMDRTRASRRYRTSLQTKYMELSQAFFGRQLAPLESQRTESKKPAASFRSNPQ